MRYLIVIFSLFFLISCSNNRTPIPRTKIVNTDTIVLKNGATVNILTENAINGGVVEDTNNYLNIVTRSDTATVVGLKIAQYAASIFSYTGGGVSGFTKEDLKGSYINTVPNPTTDILNPQLSTIVKTLKANKQKENTIIVQPYKFKLIYDGLTDDKYNFIYSTSISSENFKFVCSSDDLVTGDKTKPFSEWENNNYQLVQDITLKLIDNCINKLKLKENLSNLENTLL